MLMPSIFGENLFDDFFGDFPFYYDDRAMKDTEKKLYGRRASHIMKTDIKETDKGYELVVDLSQLLYLHRSYGCRHLRNVPYGYNVLSLSPAHLCPDLSLH